MAEKNKTKPTAFEQEMISTAKKVLDFKVAAEANVVSILYKAPDKLFDSNLVLEDFSENVWKVYYQIIHDIVLIERKNAVDDVTIGIFLEKHPKLKAKYDEYGGFDMIQKAFRTKSFQDESHKFNYVLAIVEKNINTVYMKMKQAEKAEEEVESSDMSHTVEYVNTFKSKDKKINNRLKELW